MKINFEVRKVMNTNIRRKCTEIQRMVEKVRLLRASFKPQHGYRLEKFITMAGKKLTPIVSHGAQQVLIDESLVPDYSFGLLVSGCPLWTFRKIYPTYVFLECILKILPEQCMRKTVVL